MAKDKKDLPKGIYKRGGVFWIRYAGLDGKIVFESAKQGDRSGTRVQDAEALLHERKADVGRGKQPEIRKKIPNITFKALSVEYLQWAKRQRSFPQKETLVKQLVTIFGAYPLRALNSRLLEQYQTERMEKGNKLVKVKPQGGNKPATINRHVATIKAMFTKAVEWELVEEDVLKKVRKVKLLEENNRRLRYLSKEECQALVGECRGHLRPIVIMALNTGMRRGEILSLKWDNVDMKHGFILLDKTKNGERREIPINGTLRATLAGIPRRLDLPHVFINPDTDLPYGDIKNAFNRALRKAGIRDFHFHDLRHTFASHLVMGGQDITTVKDLLGHKTLTMTLRYSHLAPAHTVKAVELLDSILNENADYTKTRQFGEK
jgi:integrase